MSACKRCGNEALRNFKCSKCGSYSLTCVEEGDCYYESKSCRLFGLTTAPLGHQVGDQIICECGCDKYDFEYDDYCGLCEGIE